MDTFKSVTISIPVDVYNRVERLSPRKRRKRHHVKDFWTQIFLDGLEHSRFVNIENRRNNTKLAVENSMLKQQLSVAQKQLQKEPHQDVPAVVIEAVARALEVVQDAPPEAGSRGR
jgi:hypothetical protein